MQPKDEETEELKCVFLVILPNIRTYERGKRSETVVSNSARAKRAVKIDEFSKSFNLSVEKLKREKTTPGRRPPSSKTAMVGVSGLDAHAGVMVSFSPKNEEFLRHGARGGLNTSKS
eukprot:1331854-Amorphochlora_amoeboformis.AAC.1